MATSGTFAFNLDLSDSIEEAFERAGLELRSGYDYRTARRSIDLLMLEWQNRGLNLWTVKEGTQVLTPGTSRYALDGKIFDIIEAYLRTDAGETTSQFDQSMSRISVSQYAHLSNKLTQSKPLEFYVEQTPDGIAVNLSNNMDLPARFLPCFVAGLAYKLAIKYPAASERAPLLKADYDEQWNLAADSAREKASLYVVPGGYQF